MQKNPNVPENVSRRAALQVIGASVVIVPAALVSCRGKDDKKKAASKKTEEAAAESGAQTEGGGGESTGAGEKMGASGGSEKMGAAGGGEKESASTGGEKMAPSTGGEKASAGGEKKMAESGSTKDCTEGVDLAADSKRMRKTLQYVSQTKQPGKMCSTCMQWIPPEGGEGACGGCKLFSGPVNANGYCLSYAPSKV